MIFVRAFFVIFCIHSLSEVVKASDLKDFPAKAQEYLNKLKVWKADFVQRNSDGGKLTGTIWVCRPGQLRIDYDEPSTSRLYIHDGWVAQRDERMDETTHIPLSRTPAGMFLQENVVLSKDVKVEGIRQDKKHIYMKLVKAEDTGLGAVVLVFQKNPFRLDGWYIVDEAQQVTEVSLKSLETKHDKGDEWFIFVPKLKVFNPDR